MNNDLTNSNIQLQLCAFKKIKKSNQITVFFYIYKKNIVGKINRRENSL